MEENTGPEENTEELPIEASEAEEPVNNEADTQESPNAEKFWDADSVLADETGMGEEDDIEGAEIKEHDSQGEPDGLKEDANEAEQVGAEEKLEEEQNGEDPDKLEAKDESEEVKEQEDETLAKESQEATDEVSAEVVATESITQKDKDKKKQLEKKESIDYELSPRFPHEYEERPKTSGDFLVMGEGAAPPVKFYKYMEEGEEEEEQEEIEVEMEEEHPLLDRTPYYEKHKKLSNALEDEKLENNILQKKLAIFFKRRRMEHVLKQTDQQVDTQQKYGIKLDAYEELIEIDTRQRQTVSEELQNLKDERETKCYQLQKQFDKLQEREKEIGIGLINCNTGNVLPDKVVERLIRLQKSEMEKVSDMRLKYIRLKYLLAEKQEAINKIDKIGEDLFLMDFDQLKVENRGLADKIEERDEELTKLRSKCQNTIQILAHIREKTAALESDIDDLKDDFTVIGLQSVQIREHLNTLKQERDYYRNMCNKLRSDSGLLTEIELLRDMEDSMADLQTLTEDLENMKAKNKIEAQQIRNIRKNIEVATEGVARKSFKYVPEKLLTHPNFYKGRPSIFSPTLPKDAFKHLKYFKPKSTIGKNKTGPNKT